MIWVTIEFIASIVAQPPGDKPTGRANAPFEDPANPAVFGQHGVYQRTQKFVEPLRYFTFALYHGRS